MTINNVLQIRGLKRNAVYVAGREAGKKVMQGSERITASSRPEKVTEWVKGAMERLDVLVDGDKRNQIMMRCGRDCARVNKRPIEMARARRKAFKTTDEFLAAEEKNPPAGTRLVREGDTLHQFYTPLAFTRPMRCYCALLRGLPDGETVSPSYCQCSRGFVQKYWEDVLGRSVGVDLVKSCVSGADECEFVVRL